LPAGFGILIVLGLAVYVIWMLLILCLAIPTAVVEDAKAFAALRRAVTLSLGTRWRMLLMFAMLVVLSWVVALMTTLPVSLAVALMPGMNSPAKSQLLGTVMLIAWYGSTFAVGALTRPVYGIALMLFYYDQRVRKEGFDIEVLMREAGMMAEAAPQPVAAPAPWMPPAASAAGETEAGAQADGPAQHEEMAGGAG
jgi:hypothetical protein